MLSKISPFLVFTFLIIGSITVPVSMQSRATQPLFVTIWYVDNINTEGPWDGSIEHPFQLIQDAVDIAKPYHEIFIHNGTYYEHIIVNKALYIYGESRVNTLIDGNYTSTVLTITASYTVIENLTIQHSGGHTLDAGIAVTADEVAISHCVFTYTKTGIFSSKNNATMIQDCTFFTNGGGVSFDTVKGGWVYNCMFDHNAIGIQFNHCSHLTILNSAVHTSGVGIQIDDSSDIIIRHSSISNNNDNRGGLFVYTSQNIIIQDCHIRHNGVGIRLTNTHDVSISNCDVMWNTHFAIGIWINVYDVTITYSQIKENLRYGINIEQNCDVSLHENNIIDNTLQGIFCLDAQAEAQQNWWGSQGGPSYYDVPWTDWVSKKTVNVYPWKKQPIKNIGCSWEYNQEIVPIYRPFKREQPLVFEGLDTDTDGVPDWWEEKYGFSVDCWNDHYHLDFDDDGLTNAEECFTDQWGSHPYIKDIFLEIDWVESSFSSTPNRPSDERIEELISIFSEHSIQLHVDRGELDGGEEIPYLSNFSFAVLRDLYWKYFLHDDMNNPRKGIFRYGLVCDAGPGSGFMFMGWDQLDTFCISADLLQENQPQWDRDLLIVGGSVHELGHTLGLTVDDYGGNDNQGAINVFTVQWWKYRNYRSCMNYFHTYKTLSYSDGSHGRGDFDDWSHLEFTFFKNSHLDWPSLV